MALGDVTRNVVSGSSDRIHSLGQDIAFFILSGLTLFRQCRPDFVNASTASVWYSAVMALVSLIVAPGVCNLETLPIMETSIMPWSGLLTITHLNVKWATVWQAAFTAAAAASYFMGDLDSKTKWYSCIYLFCHSGILILCTGWLERSMSFLIRSEIETGLLEGKHSAGSSLLRMFYDVVMELGVDFEITNPGALGSFLESSRQSFRGTTLTELIPQQDDQERFAEHVRHTQGADETMANVMHLVMSASEGKRLDVELFSVQFKGLAGSSRHLIGLREYSSDTVPEPARPANVEDPAEGRPERGAAGPRDEPPPRGGAWLRVDLGVKGAPVVSSSPGFQSLVGPLGSNASLSQLAVRPAKAISRLETFANERMNGERGAADGSSTFALRLQPPSQADVQIEATCRVDLSSILPLDAQDDESEPGMQVVLILHDVRHNRVLGKRGEDNGSFSSDSSWRSPWRRGTPMQAEDRHTGKMTNVHSL